MGNKEKRPNKNLRKVVKITLVLLFLWFLGIYVYSMYQDIEIKSSNYEIERMLSTNSEKTVEKAKKESDKIADMIEETVLKVVGISKIKDNGNSVFRTNNESELGLGTGIIVSDNGYILSNSHVTGEKYSNCYITLDN